MPKHKKDFNEEAVNEVTEVVEEKAEVDFPALGWYKSYNIKALRDDPQHPDFHLVAEYDKLKAGGGEE